MSALQGDVQDALTTIHLTDITPTMIEAIKMVVYDAHTYEGKNGYERRMGHGGLIDPDNIQMTFQPSRDSNSISVVIRNMTHGNENYSGSVWDWDKSYTYEIDRIIVEGKGYSWVNSRFYKNIIPRDFYEATRQEVETYLHERILEELIKKGW